MTPAVGLEQAPIPPPSYHRTMAAALHVDAWPNAGAALGVARAMSRGRPPGPAGSAHRHCLLGRVVRCGSIARSRCCSWRCSVRCGACPTMDRTLEPPWCSVCSLSTSRCSRSLDRPTKNSIHLPIDRAESGISQGVSPLNNADS